MAALAVVRLDLELRREDVGELGAVAVAAPDHALLGVLEVVAGQQVPEHEVRDVHVVLLVHLDRDAAPVVPHADLARGLVDFHLDQLHRVVAVLVVGRVDEDLVEDFQ